MLNSNFVVEFTNVREMIVASRYVLLKSVPSVLQTLKPTALLETSLMSLYSCRWVSQRCPCWRCRCGSSSRRCLRVVEEEQEEEALRLEAWKLFVFLELKRFRLKNNIKIKLFLVLSHLINLTFYQLLFKQLWTLHHCRETKTVFTVANAKVNSLQNRYLGSVPNLTDNLKCYLSPTPSLNKTCYHPLNYLAPSSKTIFRHLTKCQVDEITKHLFFNSI
jgi:hypothetical protein